MIALVVACTAVAGLLDESMWAAACGSAVVLAMWAIEKAAVRAGNEGSFGHGMSVALGGMVARMALALGVLVAIGLAASPEAFAAAALAFAVTYTVYNVARLWHHPAVPDGAAQADLKKRSA